MLQKFNWKGCKPENNPTQRDMSLIQGLKKWNTEREGLEERVKTECQRNQVQLTQTIMRYLNAQHPLLKDIFLCRLGSHQEYGLQKEAERLASNKYGTPLEKLVNDLNAVMAYFWQIENILYAGEVISSQSSAAAAQQNNKEIALQKKRELEENMTQLQAELISRYLQDSHQLTRLSVSINVKQTEREWHAAVQERLIDDFWRPYGVDAKYRAGLELARIGKQDELLPQPFCNLGYIGPSLDEGGFTFRIEPRCFPDPDAVLYYQDDVGWRGQSWDCFLRLSTGLTDLCRPDEKTTLFRLSEENTDKAYTFNNRGKMLLTEKLGRYRFARPGSRDFCCEFGEWWNGEKIPLAKFRI